MKNLIQISILLFLILVSTNSIAQDFIVTVESTENHGDYIVPLKPGATKTFEVKVTNGRSVGYTVSIRKYAMGNVQDWMSFSTESMAIQPSQTGTFQFTITVPSGTTENVYTLPLVFDGIDSNNNTVPFSGNDQYIIVDSSKPDTPTFSYYTTSKTVHVYGWSSWDNMSNTYTTNNTSAGIGGIKHYVLKLGSSSKTIAATGGSSYDFNASPNTSYTLSVTAVDMAGNSQSASENVSTPPAKVTGLSFSDIKYTNVKLSWNASAGATSYDVNMYYNGETTTVGNNVTTTSFTIPGLSPDETYDFYVYAKNSAGSSEVSDKATVTTATLPRITGSALLCTGAYSYSINNLLPGYSITWNSLLTRVSVQGSNPCTFKADQITGRATINATITDSYSTSADLNPKLVWAGEPDIYRYNEFGEEVEYGEVVKENVGTVVTFEAYSHDFTANISWDVTPSSAYYVDNGNTCSIMTSSSGFIGAMAIASNTCGEDIMINTLTPNSGGFPLSMEISPNPASETLNITISEVKSETIVNMMSTSSELTVVPESYEIQIWSERKGLVKKQKLKGKKNQIDISSLKPGLYFVHLIYNDKVVKKQLIIE
ncbi:fibronectin type III domain-containing protein [Carboxylicivirga sp. A043]|uniref:fibronectin type III domain-containing protein n=1 Tax=Carboxylicivirga litoralis TaxID=2816963 RepID=UPI0021CAFCFE|nr:fibronectin type III domain-containing protein [Carboxylicivirga sp. A043]MCU4155332.1 fibronectin type III domain-containing protein [Carboxylicivirga sp. A043]